MSEKLDRAEHGVACRLMIEARLSRRIREAVITNIEDGIRCPRSAAAGLLKPTTLDADKECDPDQLMLGRDFNDEDFITARRMIGDKETWGRIVGTVLAVAKA